MRIYPRFSPNSTASSLSGLALQQAAGFSIPSFFPQGGYMLLTRVVAGTFSVVMLVFGTDGAFGQTFPNKPVRIVTAAAGGGSDFTARLIAQGISGPLGQPVIVDNRASGILGGEVMSKAA